MSVRTGIAVCRRALQSLSVASVSSFVPAAPRCTVIKPAAVSFMRCAPAYRSFHGSPRTDATVPFLLADIGEGITECEVIQWFVKEGDHVEQFSKICEVQSDKASVEITSRYDGVIKRLHYEAGSVARVGTPLVDIETEEAAAPTNASSAHAEASEVEKVLPAVEQAAIESISVEGDRPIILTTPAVRRIAREHQVDLVKVKGTGPSGRILKGDVLAFVSGMGTGGVNDAAPASAASATSVSQLSPPKEDTLLPLTPIQKAMFKTMTRSLQIPHFGFSDEIILNSVSTLRSQINMYLSTPDAAAKYPFKKISYMPILIKALEVALRDERFRILNGCLVNKDGKLVEGGEGVADVKVLRRESVNVGVAMDTPQGLIVPNIKNVQQRSILDIAGELHRLAQAAKTGSLAPQDLSGGTITLSNIGTIGGINLHPVLVPTELCIGAIGKIQTLPRYELVDGVEKVVKKEVLTVSFNADHRVVDGATVARFVSRWKKLLEDGVMVAELV
ncbi:hypothetical protein HDU85_001639 [Gaertneriomyces sp. JEL0708]|nr:hypothetical protein HDU85_001639 [Gaertneriomyces sp. JEL0708]